MTPAQATLWRKAAVATAFDLRRRIAGAARRAADGARAGKRVAQTRAIRAIAGTCRAIGNAAARARAAGRGAIAALLRHRHGTWLILFGLLFTLLWLLAGAIGMGNGLLRGLLVGTATPLLVNALFPLKPAAR